MFHVYSSVCSLSSTDKIGLLAAIGSWVAGIGTVAAVITSLFLSRSQTKLKLNVRVALMIAIDETGKTEYCMISAVNAGLLPVTISNVGWSAGILKIGRREAIQAINNSPLSSRIPTTLNRGDEFKVFIPISNWLENAAKFLDNKPYLAKTLKAMVVTSMNEVVKIKISRDLRKLLIGVMNK